MTIVILGKPDPDLLKLFSLCQVEVSFVVPMIEWYGLVQSLN